MATITPKALRREAALLKAQYERMMAAADILEGRPPSKSVLTSFSPPSDGKPMSQIEAARHVLQLHGGPMRREQLFKEVQLLSPRGKSLESFCIILSRTKDIFVRGQTRGTWELRQPGFDFHNHMNTEAEEVA